MKTLIIHIGHYKTGTSYFQSQMYGNRQALRDRGLIYPETGLGLTGHNPYSHRLIGLRLDGEGRNQLQQIIGDLKADDAATAALISYEGFANPHITRQVVEQAALFEGVTVKVLLVLRSHLDMAISLYREICQNVGYKKSFDGFLDDIRNGFRGWTANLNYARIIGDWSGVAGASNIITLNYADLGLDIVAGLLAAADFKATDLEVTNPSVNPSLSAPATEIARRLNVAGMAMNDVRKFTPLLQRIDAKNPGFADICEITEAQAHALNDLFQTDRKDLQELGVAFAGGWQPLTDWKWGRQSDLARQADEAWRQMRHLMTEDELSSKLPQVPGGP